MAFALQQLRGAQGGKKGGRGEEGLIVGEEPDKEQGWEKGCGGQGRGDRGYVEFWGPQANPGPVLAPRRPLRNGLVKDKRF